MVKCHAVKDHVDNFREFLQWIIPVMSYHDRWKSLTREDFIKSGYTPETFTRGYDFQPDQYIELAEEYSDIPVPKYVVNKDAGARKLEAESLFYLNKIAKFCEANDIRLVLIKIPSSHWTDGGSIATQQLADQYGIDYIDFNYEPYVDELDYNYAIDNREEAHLSYHGASKITKWLGNYLVEECGNRDVRGDEAYKFMDEEWADYKRSIAKADLKGMTDPYEYLSYLEQLDDFVVFISVKGDAADALRVEQRTRFAGMGLTGLAGISNGDSYLAIIDDGKVVIEQSTGGQGIEKPLSEGSEVLACEGTLSGGESYTIRSGGYDYGDLSSIVIDGEEYARGQQGLNFVVYDKRTETVVDRVVFDTHVSDVGEPQYYGEALVKAESEGKNAGDLSGRLLQLYLYNRMCSNIKEMKLTEQAAGDDGVLDYLRTCMRNEDYEVFLSVKDDAAGALDDASRVVFADMGLDELAKLQRGDSYLAVIEGGNIEEIRDHGSEMITADGLVYKVVSGGYDSENISSIVIAGEEYSNNSRGLNIVVYDVIADRVVSSVTFDTSMVTPVISEETKQ